jgi:Tol biopolymer transport system component
VRDIASGKETQITSDDDRPNDPLFSPDLKQIVYSGFTTDQVLADRDSERGSKVVANKSGATSKVLNSSPEYILLPAGWTADGKSILVAGMMTVDRTWMLAWVSASDGSVTPLKSLGWRFDPWQMSLPAVSPDGRYIAYTASVSDRPPGARGQAVSSSDSPNSGGVHLFHGADYGSRNQ